MTASAAPRPGGSSLDVRGRLVEALRLDLVGPWAQHSFADERLPGWVRPSNWYLTGFLIPSGMPVDKAGDENEDEDLELVPESAGLAEESNEERKSAKKGYFPSSMGLSFLVTKVARQLTTTVRWGDYEPSEIQGEDGKPLSTWQRTPREVTLPVLLTGSQDDTVTAVPGSRGLELHVVEHEVGAEDLADRIPTGTRSVSIFLVNRRPPDADRPDVAYVFQAEIEVRSEEQFVPRPDLRGSLAADWDEQVADLHYADTPEYATGHGVSADWQVEGGACRVLRTAWIPQAEVEKTATVDVPEVELSMEAL